MTAFHSPLGDDRRLLQPGSYWCLIYCEPAGVYQGHDAIEAPPDGELPRTPTGLTVSEALVTARAVQALLRAQGQEAPDPDLRVFLANVLVGLCAVTERDKELIVAPGLFAAEQRRAGPAGAPLEPGPWPHS
jgi:hypothetical protein